MSTAVPFVKIIVHKGERNLMAVGRGFAHNGDLTFCLPTALKETRSDALATMLDRARRALGCWKEEHVAVYVFTSQTELAANRPVGLSFPLSETPLWSDL